MSDTEGLSLYQRLGGEAAIQAAVFLFYDKILKEPRLARYFVDMDMPAQIKKQVDFLSVAFGGKSVADVKDLTEAHERPVKMGLNDEDFDLTAGILVESLVELGVSEDIVEEVKQLVLPLRDKVLGRA